MADERDILTGFVVLTNERTGEVRRLEVLIVPDAAKITYTAQSIDHSRRETVTWHRSECRAFQEMMQLVDRVTRQDRLTA
jgi:hypothetical protein